MRGWMDRGQNCCPLLPPKEFSHRLLCCLPRAAELAEEDKRERKRAERMSRPGTSDYWRSDAPEDYSGAAAARGGAGDDDEDDEGSGEEDGPQPGMSMQHMMMGIGMMGMGSSDEGSDEQGECSDASQ